MKKMLLGGLLCLLVVLGGCSSEEKTYDEDKVVEKAKELVTWLNDGEYEKIVQEENEQLKSLTADKLKEAWEASKKGSGDFKEFTDHEMVEKDGLAVLGIIGTYENAAYQFTITFDSDMKLAGFFIKQV